MVPVSLGSIPSGGKEEGGQIEGHRPLPGMKRKARVREVCVYICACVCVFIYM